MRINRRIRAANVTNRKAAEEKARLAEEKDRAILAAVPDLMFLQTPDGVYIDYQAKNRDDLLAPPETFLGRNMREVLPPDLAERFSQCFHVVITSQQLQLFDYSVNVGGKDRWFEARMVPCGDNILSVVRDITERVNSEKTIKQSEAQLSGIIGTAMDAIITVDANQKIVMFNAAAEKIFGWPASEIVGGSLDQLIPLRYRHGHHGYLRGFSEQSVTHRAMSERGAELFGLKRSGEEFPMEASISQIELSGQKLFTVILRDITDRKEALKELSLSEERFSKAFRANPQPMTLTKVASGLYVDVNDSFLEMSGYTREEVIGHTSLELGIWDLPQSRTEFISKLTTQGSVTNFETKFRTKNGDIRILLSSSERLEIHGEECLILASTDITERVAAQKALAIAHEELVNAHDEVKRLKAQLEAENIYLQEEIRQDQSFGDIVGQSKAIRDVLAKVGRVASTDSTVLITGETGTGKELVARAIHRASDRADRPLIKLNCAALSRSLIESELFGHEKGAFTGAVGRRNGRFELANSGTLLLDEIGELPLDLQAKMLRVLQEGEFERVGSGKPVKVDVRIIACTNRDLKSEVERGRFREDLWYRLNVFPIDIPPLRKRRDDIPILTEHYAVTISQKLGKRIKAVDPATMKTLCEYSWPGNIRELANFVERAVINSTGTVLQVREDLALLHESGNLPTSVKTLAEMERDHIVGVLNEFNWRINGPNGVARLLGINPSTLRTRMVKLGVQKPR